MAKEIPIKLIDTPIKGAPDDEKERRRQIEVASRQVNERCLCNGAFMPGRNLTGDPPPPPK